MDRTFVTPSAVVGDGSLVFRSQGWLGRRVHAFKVVAPFGFLGIMPAAFIAVKLVAASRVDAFAIDFRNAYWPAGRAFLDGMSPYLPVTPEAFAQNAVFAYPPPAAALMAPFALLPRAFAGVLFTVLVAAALVAALRVLGVSDWRCYGAAFLWPPVAYAVQSANITLLLALGLALGWRFRSRAIVVGCVIGVLLALKLFLWPLLIWLVAARRYRATAAALATAALATLAAWSAMGFSDLGTYTNMLGQLKELSERDAYTPFAVAANWGMDAGLAHMLGYVIAGIAGVAAYLVGRRKADEPTAFLLAVVTALLANPLTWIHSFALLIVPIAVLRPRFSWVWAAPIVLVIAPARAPTPSFGLLTLSFFGALAAVAWAGHRRRPSPA